MSRRGTCKGRSVGLTLALPPAMALFGGVAAAAGVTEPGGMLGELVSTVLALILVSVLAYVAVRVMRRLGVSGGASASAEPRFVRALPVGPHERLVVVEWRGETLLLGVTAGSVAVLDRGDLIAPTQSEAADVAPEAAVRALFDRVRSVRGLRANPREGVP